MVAAFDCLSPDEQKEMLIYLHEEADLKSSTLNWKPFIGPQMQAYYSPADELLYGGAAGGGRQN